MFDDRLFFQLAAALIPAVLFGGLVTGAFTPSKNGPALPVWARVGRFILVAVGVGLVLFAEIFAIDLATSPETPPGYKIAVIVFVVVAATTLAGGALLRPWMETLPPSYRPWAEIMSVLAGTAVVLIGSSVLTRSIVEAEGRRADERLACFRAETTSRLREGDRFEFDVADVGATRNAELLELKHERIILDLNERLNPSARRRLQASLQERVELAESRLKRSQEIFLESLLDGLGGGDPTLDDLLEDLDEGVDPDEAVESYLRAFSC